MLLKNKLKSYLLGQNIQVYVRCFGFDEAFKKLYEMSSYCEVFKNQTPPLHYFMSLNLKKKDSVMCRIYFVD